MHILGKNVTHYFPNWHYIQLLVNLNEIWTYFFLISSLIFQSVKFFKLSKHDIDNIAIHDISAMDHEYARKVSNTPLYEEAKTNAS